MKPIKKHINKRKLFIKKQNKKRITARDRLTHPVNNVAKTGSSRDQVPGPGFIYEIDSTKLQIYIVSRFGRRRIVGQPTLYLLVDVWSGCIVGFALSLNSPSYDLAASALLCCHRKKDEPVR